MYTFLKKKLTCKNDTIIQRVVIYEQLSFVIYKISRGAPLVRTKNRHQNPHDKSYLNGCSKVKQCVKQHTSTLCDQQFNEYTNVPTYFNSKMIFHLYSIYFILGFTMSVNLNQIFVNNMAHLYSLRVITTMDNTLQKKLINSTKSSNYLL